MPESSETRPSVVSRNRPRLLPNLLEHEVLVAALFRLDRIPLNARDLALDGLAVKVGQLHAGQRQNRHVPIGQKINVARVMQNAGHVGGHKRLALAHADHHRRTEARDHNLVRLGGRQHAQRKGSGEPLHGAPHGHFQRNRLAGFSASFCTCSIRWAMISVSVSVTNLWPCAVSSRFSSR